MIEMIINGLIAIVVAFLTGGGFIALIKYRQSIKLNPPMRKDLDDVSKIYEHLNACKRKTGAIRVVLIRLHNGGGRPKAGTPMYSSAVYEVYKDSQEPVVKNWQKERVDNDDQYREMLIDMFDNGCTRCEVDKMGAGKLKDVYVITGVTRNLVINIGYRDSGKEHFYMSLVFDNKTPINEPLENDSARVTANKIKHILGCE